MASSKTSKIAIAAACITAFAAVVAAIINVAYKKDLPEAAPSQNIIGNSISGSSVITNARDVSITTIEPSLPLPREMPTFAMSKMTDYFPLKLGNWWAYKGKSTVIEGGPLLGNRSPKETERTVRVVDEIKHPKRPDVKLFVLKGSIEHPDADWMLLVIGNKIYDFENSEIISSVRRQFLDGAPFIQELEGKWALFEFPMFEGQILGDSKYFVREDYKYLWRVDDVRQWHYSKSGKTTELTEFRMSLNTGPDATFYYFTPGVGVTRYEYRHHGGTELDETFELTNYYLN